MSNRTNTDHTNAVSSSRAPLRGRRSRRTARGQQRVPVVPAWTVTRQLATARTTNVDNNNNDSSDDDDEQGASASSNGDDQQGVPAASSGNDNDNGGDE